MNPLRFRAPLHLQDDERSPPDSVPALSENILDDSRSGDKAAVLHEVTAYGFIAGTVQYAL